jgi:hypothetical protein
VGFVVGFRFATKCLAFSGEVLVLVLLGPCCSLVPDIVDLVVEPAVLLCLVLLVRLLICTPFLAPPVRMGFGCRRNPNPDGTRDFGGTFSL